MCARNTLAAVARRSLLPKGIQYGSRNPEVAARACSQLDIRLDEAVKIGAASHGQAVGVGILLVAFAIGRTMIGVPHLNAAKPKIAQFGDERFFLRMIPFPNADRVGEHANAARGIYITNRL